jgi:2,4-dienoyl-CoA reductase-like NADH-dependent reductase (Old Yellow Enzyme family)
MKIKPPSRSVLDPERLHNCADALEPYVYALFRIVDYRQADTAQPNFRQVSEAARAAGWDDVAISAAIDYLTAAFAMAGDPAWVTDDARRL